MRRKTLAFSLCTVALAAVIGIVLHEHKTSTGPTTAESPEPEPTASVTTAPLHMGQITQTITAYGTITAEPGSIAIYSVPFECRVKRVPVNIGQKIDDKTVLMEIEPSSDARLQLLEAANTVDAANKDLKETQQRFDLKLATNQDLLQSQQNQQTAQVKLEHLQQSGGAGDQGKIIAKTAGFVVKIDAQDGQIIPADSSMAQIAPSDKTEIHLGVEPDDASQLKVGQVVQWFAQNGKTDDGEGGKIHFIASRINPETRLIDVLITPDSHDSLVLDSSVRAELVTNTKQALIVPRSAVLSEDNTYSLFTVKDDHAVKHVVILGLKNENEVEVTGDGLKDGDAVVVQGNMELEDGMSVTIAEPPTTQATTEPGGAAQ
jgi:membrane fusion protein, multidrug efflux system